MPFELIINSIKYYFEYNNNTLTIKAVDPENLSQWRKIINYTLLFTDDNFQINIPPDLLFNIFLDYNNGRQIGFDISFYSAYPELAIELSPKLSTGFNSNKIIINLSPDKNLANQIISEKIININTKFKNLEILVEEFAKTQNTKISDFINKYNGLLLESPATNKLISDNKTQLEKLKSDLTDYQEIFAPITDQLAYITSKINKLDDLYLENKSGIAEIKSGLKLKGIINY